MARGAGIEHAYTVTKLDDFRPALRAKARRPVAFSDRGKSRPQRPTRTSSASTATAGRTKYIFVRHVEQTENIVIMGPERAQLEQSRRSEVRLPDETAKSPAPGPRLQQPRKFRALFYQLVLLVAVVASATSSPQRQGQSRRPETSPAASVF